jgi:uncharacterized protein DUF6665
MTVRPPHPFAPKLWANSPVAALDYEIAQEKASTLGRLGRALEAAIEKLRAFDDETPEKTSETRRKRRMLVDAAGHALWLFVVQREAIGLRDTRTLMRDYRVPAEVFNRMGAAPIKVP